MLRGLRRLLRLKGYEIETAESGEQAVERARQFDPHGVLMDIRMPGMNGVEAYRQIRVDCPDAFVCFMTAYSELATQAQQESLSEVLSKPIDVDAMCDLISREARNRPVLIVDDDPDFCLSLQRVLSARWPRVDTARCAQEAKDIFSKRPRAILLLDMNLGETSGFEVLLDLQAINPNVVVIAMSGMPEMQRHMHCELGDVAAACLEKPLDLKRLAAKLDELAAGPPATEQEQ